jgi:ABC-type glutathione transport system ATPase component
MSDYQENSAPAAADTSTESVADFGKLRRRSTIDENYISLHEVSPVDVAVRHISVRVDHLSKGTKKFRNALQRNTKSNDEEAGPVQSTVILDNVSADMPSGSLTAIIGASGSGKTTL